MRTYGLWWWWDDAVSYARLVAAATGRRQRVFREVGGLWGVREVDA